MAVSPSSRPGLAKTRGDHLVRAHAMTWLRVSDGHLRAMFEAADIVSEGSVQVEGDTRVWYGTTSLVLPWPPRLIVRHAREFVATVASRDPHVRLRAVRTAHREAAVRAPGSLGRAECEVRVGGRDEGLRIDVDVQAPLTLRSRAAHHRAPG